jgi:hypothetical protein
MTMQDSDHGAREGHAPAPHANLEQFPVDVFLTKVSFFVDGIDFVRIVVTNEQRVAPYEPGREYYFVDRSVSIEDVEAFTLSCGTLRGHKGEIEAFAGSMPAMFTIPQAAVFVRGVHAPTSERRRLYQAKDPDDANKVIGLLLEQNARGELERITWYKAQDAKVAFRSPPPSLRFELVRNEGKPSTDPAHMGGWSWYHASHPERAK